MQTRKTKIITLIIGIWAVTLFSLFGQVTVTLNGPNYVPVGANCKTSFSATKNDFTFTANGCMLDLDNDVTVSQDKTVVPAGDNITVTVDVNSPGCPPNQFVFILPAKDITAPVFKIQPTPITEIVCQGSGNQTFFNSWLATHGGAVIEDNCTASGNIVWTTDPVNPQMPTDYCTPGEVTVIFKAADEGGNVVSSNPAVFRIIDNKAPNITSNPFPVSFECNKSTNYNAELTNWVNTLAMNQAKVSDECTSVNNISWSVKIDNGPEQSIPTQLTIDSKKCNVSKSIVFIARDQCNNAAIFNPVTFKITDGIPPLVQKPAADFTHQCNGSVGNALAFSGWLSNRGGAKFTDQCLDSLSLTYSTIPANPQVPANSCNGSAEVTFRATDACGNIAETKAKFILKDEVAPVINNVPKDTLFYCSMPALPPAPNNITATDNCTPNLFLDFSEKYESGPCGPNTIIKRTWSTQDNCGNIRAKTQIIQIIDTLAPVLTGIVPNDVTVSCENIPAAPPVNLFTATDDCNASVPIEFKEINNAASCNAGYPIIRLWIAKDNCGNADTLSQKIYVIDNLPPVLLGVPGDVTVTCSNIPTAPVIGSGITATDNCDTNVKIVLDEVSTIGVCINNKYQITRTWTATDDCGNFVSKQQKISVTDNDFPVFKGVPENITVDCSMIPGIPQLGGSFKVTDGCDPNVNVTFSQTTTQNPDSTSCDHYSYQLTRYWVANDDCGHVTTVQQKVTVQDKLAPTLFCVDTFVIANNPLQCKAVSGINDLVFFSHGCSSISGTDSVTQTLFLTHSGADVMISPVDDLHFSLPVQGVPAAYLTGNILLRIDLNNVDAEEVSEFFRIYTEDGNLLGQTQHTAGQCGNSSTFFTSITPDKINQWAFDGYVSFTLKTNGNGVNAINNFCQGGNVKLSLKFDYITSPKISSKLFYSVDKAPFKQFVPGLLETFSLGNHEIKVKVEDCAGKFDSCNYILKVKDVDAPSINCPGDITAETLPLDCNLIYNLPPPVNVFDNCGFSSLSNTKTTPTNIFFQDHPQAGKIPQDIIANFFGQPPIANGSLKIYLKADIANNGEFFFVYDENNNLLGQTGKGLPALECNEYQEFSIPVTQTQISQWSLDGVIRFTLKANANTNSFSDFINPCGTLDAKGKDPVSMVYFELIYPAYEIHYIVRDSNNVILTSQQYFSGSSKVELPVGKNKISYTVVDGGGNIGSCSFNATILDKTPPKLTCKAGTIIDLNPSGLIPTIVSPYDLLVDTLFKIDNCGIETFTVTPNNFNCQMAGQGTTIKVIARDFSGNKDSCSSIVFFKNESLTPTISLDTCGGKLSFIPDTTFKTPTPSTGNFFNYSWVGPNNFTSNLPSPVLLAPSAAYSGVYTLTVTGLTGCQSSGSVMVNIDPSGLFKPTVYSNSPVCEGDSITIYTDWNNALNYTWTNVNTQQQFVTAKNYLRLPADIKFAGAWSVKVGLNIGCNSLNSETHQVLVSLLSVTTPDTIQACKGIQVQLSAQAIAGALFEWTAPNGFKYPGKNPNVPPIDGVYKVLVKNAQGCIGKDSLYVHVNDRPEITAISHSCPGCVSGTEACTIEPSVFPIDTGNYTYQWFNPSGGLFSIDSVASLANISANAGGQYQLIVTDKFSGCSSVPGKIDVNLNNTPATPLITQDDSTLPAKLCEGQPLIIKLTSNPYSGDVKYIWTTPLGKDTTTVPSLTYASSTVNNAGMYQLQVLINGCLSNVSNEIFAEVYPIPFPPPTFTNSPICDGDTLKLFADLIPGAAYEWIGPTGVFSTLQNPLIADAKPGDSGTYRVRITVNGCTSLYSAANNVFVGSMPAAPFVEQQCNGSVCASDPAAGCLLKVIAPQAGSGSSFSLYNSAGVLLAGPQLSDSLYLKNLTQSGSGLKTFYVTVTTNGCESLQSLPVQIQLDTIPKLKANAGQDIFICENIPLQICATAVNTGSGQWSQLSGPVVQILTPFDACSNIAGSKGGQNVSFVWSLSNGACLHYSQDTVNVSISEKMQASAETPVQLCKDEPVFINALAGNGVWTQPDAQASAGVVIQNPASASTAVFNLSANNSYIFDWVVDNGACGTEIAQVTLGIYDDHAFAGDDRADCGLGCLKIPLQADIPVFGSGVWSSADSIVFFKDPFNPATEVCGLKNGIHKFVWTTNNGVCGKNSVDTIIINYQYLSLAVTDTLNVTFAESGFIDVLQNDSLVSAYTLKMIQTPSKGKINNLGNGKFIYSPNPDFIGVDIMKYALCSNLCPDECTEAEVVFNVGGDIKCNAPTIITPNDDGVNDAFIVPCLAIENQYPANTVSVFNQWGDEIFHASPYNNDWEGTYKDNPVPPGTYFYVIDLGDGTKPFAGFLIIKR